MSFISPRNFDSAFFISNTKQKTRAIFCNGFHLKQYGISQHKESLTVDQVIDGIFADDDSANEYDD